MEKSFAFMTDDGAMFDVPQSKLETFRKDAQDKKERIRTVKMYADPDGGIFDVPEDKHDAFMQDAQAKGVPVEEVTSYHTMGKTFDVPKSRSQAFFNDWNGDAEADIERDEAAKKIASKLDAPDSPLWAGVKGFVSGLNPFGDGNPFSDQNRAGISASAANVFRGVAQAPATIADKLGAAEQFGSRVRELPGMKVATLTNPAMQMTGLAGMGLEALLSLRGKDGGKEYRRLIQNARDYVDAKREEYLGYRNEKGEKATSDDFATTLGGQAVNSVAESYLLTAPKIMQGINTAMRAGGAGLVSRLTPTLQTMLYGASTAEGTASKADAKGMSNEKAVGMGLLTGTIESALESVSQVTGLQDAMSKSAMKEAIAQTVWKKVGNTLKDATGESLTEFGQQLQQGTIEKLSKIDDKTWEQIGIESASSAALGFISGGASASANGVFDGDGGSGSLATMQGGSNMQDGGNSEVSNEQIRMEQEAAAAGEGERATRESVLEGETAQAQNGEGVQPPIVDEAGGAIEDPAVAGENRRGFQVAAPLIIADGVTAEPVETSLPVKAGEQPRTAQQVRIKLANGKQLYSNDPGLIALVQYWYKDRVLFPAAPAGDRGAQEGDVTMNASRRAGFEVKPAKRVWVNIGKSKKGYMGTVVQVLDGQTVRVKIDKTQRSLKNSRAGYADVDVRTIQQLASVIGKQKRAELTKGMPKEEVDRLDALDREFKQEIIDGGLFIDTDAFSAIDTMKGGQANKKRDELVKDAYRRASEMMGIPLDNHLQRGAALPLLQEFQARMQGSEGMPYDSWVETLARESEADTADRRASGEFSLADMTPDEMAQADSNLEAQRTAASQRAEIMRRAQAPIVGTTGDMTGVIPGMEDFTFDDTPLFGFRGQEDQGSGVQVEDTGEELPFNMAPDAVTPEQDAAYLEAVRGGDTDTAQRMVDEAAKAAGYTTPKVYHGTPKNFTIFDSGKIGNRGEPTYGNGFYFSTSGEDSWMYGGNTITAYLSYKNPLGVKSDISKEDKAEIEKRLKAGNHDALVVVENGASKYVVVFSPDQVKSADPITYDDAGNVIPLSERFNQASDDLRYNVAPEAAGVYNQDTSGGADTPRAQEQAAEKTPINTPPWMQERNAVGMDLMDAVSMVYQLTGKFPKVLEKLRRTRALGYFDPNTKEVVLWAKIFGLVDDTDRARIRKALEAKGFEGEKLYQQEAVEVKALMEKRRKEHQKRPLKVAVHELAHLVDFLPDSTVKRGNILGHIAAFTKFMKHAIGPEPGAQGPLTEQEKSELRRRVQREMQMMPVQTRQYIEEAIREFPQYKVLGVTPDDIKGLLGLDGQNATPELYDWFTRQESDVKRAVIVAAMKGVVDQRVGQAGNEKYTDEIRQHNKTFTKEAGRKRFRELLKEETERRRLIELKQIKEEARKIIPWWRGVETMEAYFEQPAEMYAELMGIFLADPSELQRRAPTVHRAFMGWMDARPEVAEAYRAFLDARNMPADKQAAARILMIKQGMTKEAEDSRRELLKLSIQTALWDKWNSFTLNFHRKTAPTKSAIDRTLKVLTGAAKSDAEKANLLKAYWSARVAIKRPKTIGRIIQGYESEIDYRVTKPLDKLGFDMVDLGVYQKLRRVAYELDGKAATAGLEPASALKLLDHLRQEYGDERWEKLQKYALEFRRIREEHIISNPDLRAMYDQELLEKLDNNVEYVTFQKVPTKEEIDQFKDALKRAKSGDPMLREDVSEFLTREMESKLGSAVGSKIFKYVGSFGPVANPIVATLSKDEQMIRSATHNTLKRKVYEFVKPGGIDVIREVEYEKNSRGVMVPKMVDDGKWKTIVYMQDGQIKGYLASIDLAHSLESGRSTDMALVRGYLTGESFIRNLLTTLNPFYNLKNNMRDPDRAATLVKGMKRMRLLPGVNMTTLPGGSFVSSMMRYGVVESTAKTIAKVLPWTLDERMIEWTLSDGRRAARLIQTNTIDATEDKAKELMRKGDTRKAERLFSDVKLAKAGLRYGFLISHSEQIREDSNADDFTRRLYRNGIGKQDLTKGLNAAASILGYIKTAARHVEGWGETGELTTKLATWKFLETHPQGLSLDERIIMTRELGGSPDFSERGTLTPYVEAITRSFMNASKEGTITALSAASKRPWEVGAKVMTNYVMPTMVRHMLASGFLHLLYKWYEPDDEKRRNIFGARFAEWYYQKMRLVPNYILKNFHSFPMPVKSLEGTNFTAILRTPMDQTGQAISLATWDIMDGVGETVIDYLNRNNPNASPTVLSRTENPLMEIANTFAASIGPDAIGEGMLISLEALLYGFITGGNYFDSFTGRDVWDEDELIARSKNPAAAKVLVGEIWNRLGGAAIVRYKRDNPFGEELPELGKLLNLPGIQPSVGAFFNVYTGGEAQMERKLGRIKKEMEAPIKVEARQDFANSINESGQRRPSITDEMLKKMGQSGSPEAAMRGQLYNEEIQSLIQKFYNTESKRGEFGEIMRFSNEKNIMMRDYRRGVIERNRKPSIMEGNRNPAIMDNGSQLMNPERAR